MAAVATARRLFLLLLLLLAVASAAGAAPVTRKHERWRVSGGAVVEKERRRVVAESEAGSVTAVDVADAAGTAYRLHFITMDPGALFLPVQLHADMVFYVHSGTLVTCTCLLCCTCSARSIYSVSRLVYLALIRTSYYTCMYKCSLCCMHGRS